MTLCGETDDVLGTANQLAHLPFWVHHDIDDPTVPVVESDDFVAALEVADAPSHTYTKLDNSQPDAHAIWWRVYRRPELYDWMLGWSLDTDGDGTTAREEYEAGTAPTDPESVFTILTAGKNENGFGLSWSSVPGRSYTVYQSEHLSGGWQAVARDIAADPSMINFIRLPDGTAEKMFYRVETHR